MKRLFLFGVVAFLIDGVAVGQSLFDDVAVRDEVRAAFALRRAQLPSLERNVFSVHDACTDAVESDALAFLFGSAPLWDLATHDGAWFLQQVQAALHVRSATPWGRSVPATLFLHFVLPPRVNNEATDSARAVFQRMLLPRIQGMDMRRAALEVNHWCREHVTYRPSDARTSSPLATLRTAFGRCGEESVFAVAALRAVGIPARQCYTPRWAHVDDNHAWVELWVDGSWHYLGACEPEPDLDMAWFSEPVLRAMLTATTVHGKYHGPEPVLARDTWTTRINTLDMYTGTRDVHVRVLDNEGRGVADAVVEFRIYNYAELFPIAAARSDAQGWCDFRTGHGDVFLWARHKGSYATALLPASRDSVQLVLGDGVPPGTSQEYDLVPPRDVRLPATSEHPEANAHARRVQRDDSLRASYERGFIDSTGCARAALRLGLPADSVWHFVHAARGNWRELLAFLDSAAREALPLPLALLHVISDKDLRDTPASVLLDHARHVRRERITNMEQWKQYVLNPRIAHEHPSAWRVALSRHFAAEAYAYRADPRLLARWIADSIAVDSSNWARVPIAPERALLCKRVDTHSRDVLFVAAARALGIPARMDMARMIPQFFHEGTWMDVRADGNAVASTTGTVTLLPAASSSGSPPEYTRHYTISRIRDGQARLLDFEGDARLATLPASIPLDTGSYMLLTGNRQPDGTVLAEVTHFTVAREKETRVSLRLRERSDVINLLGTVQPEHLPSLPRQGALLVYLEAASEPVTHAVNSFRALREEFDTWGGAVLLAASPPSALEAVRARHASAFPERSIWMSDRADALLAEVAEQLALPGAFRRPLIVLLDGDGRIVYAVNGYTINVAEQVLRLAERMLR